VFNDLFCLSAPGIHTISGGWRPVPGRSRPSPRSVALLPQAPRPVAAIWSALENAPGKRPSARLAESFWVARGCRSGPDTPGGHQPCRWLALAATNCLEAWDLESLRAGAAYWPVGPGVEPPGSRRPMPMRSITAFLKASCLCGALAIAPGPKQIPDLLRRLPQRLGGRPSQLSDHVWRTDRISPRTISGPPVCGVRGRRVALGR